MFAKVVTLVSTYFTPQTFSFHQFCIDRNHYTRVSNTRPAMVFGNFQVINISVIYLVQRCLKVFGQAFCVTLKFQLIDRSLVF